VPYASLSDLPASVRDSLPDKAQEIFKEAFNSAWEQYADPADRQGDASREETANRVAWAAVKSRYRRVEQGHWVEK
jgi:cation transport regulator